MKSFEAKGKEDFSSPNGSKNTNGFLITVRSKQHSVTRVQNTDRHTIIYHLSSLSLPLVSVTRKKGVERLKDHNQSENHKNATKQKIRSQPAVDCQIDSQV